VTVRRCYHAKCKDRLHILRRVTFARADWEGPDLGDALSAGRAPPGPFDREQLHLIQRLDYDTTRSFGRLRRGAARVRVQVPEHLYVGEPAQRLIGHNPASHLTCPLADRLARADRDGLRRCPISHREHQHHPRGARQCARCTSRDFRPSHPILQGSSTDHLAQEVGGGPLHQAPQAHHLTVIDGPLVRLIQQPDPAGTIDDRREDAQLSACLSTLVRGSAIAELYHL
jgi:hypothetical protein